jgi:hypothetical protein
MLRTAILWQCPETAIVRCWCGVVNVSVDKADVVPCSYNFLVNGELRKMGRKQ